MKEHFDKVENWYRNDRKRVFIISGFAGCGKTTLARQIPDELNIRHYKMLAPTGKAANVLGEGAQTIHSYLYNTSVDKDTGKFYFTMKRQEEFTEQLLLVDEISMVNEDLLAELRATNIPIIGFGDPAQLPPVHGSSSILDKPDIFLTHVWRNDGGLLDIATDVRQGKRVKQKYDNVNFRSSIIDDIQMIDKDSVVIVRYNKTRNILNLVLRAYLYGFSETIEIGEKLMILRNDRERGLTNGSIVEVLEIRGYNDFLNVMTVLVKRDDDYELEIDINLKTITKQKNKTLYNDTSLDVDYAYAITCHKSQGSEYDKVFVIKQGLNFDDWRKWYYTALTRAKKELYIYPDMDYLLSSYLSEFYD